MYEIRSSRVYQQHKWSMDILGYRGRRLYFFSLWSKSKKLYKVVKKVAYKNAENLPPWPPVTFKMSGNTYHFPFRFYLKQERILDEPMIRLEFAYVAENLLLRGGYRKTHFQADIVTFYNVSNMGEFFNGRHEALTLNAEKFTPKIVFERNKQKNPEKFYFHELILQSLLRKKLKDSPMNDILNYFNLKHIPEDFEILGEKALPEDFVDVFIKLKHPIGASDYLLVEVKTGKATKRDFEQLKNYIYEFGNECKGGILIAKDFPRKVLQEVSGDIMTMRYSFENIDYESEYTFEELLKMLNLEVV